MRKPLTILILLCACCFAAVAQTKKNTKPKPKPAATPSVTTTKTHPDLSPVVETPVKKNGRPDDAKTNTTPAKSYTPVYFYTYEREGFQYPDVRIEHDEAGKGQISFKKDAYEDLWTDPIQLTPVTMAALRSAFANLNFLNSVESYQFPGRDFSNMGNVTITVKGTDHSRTAKYNWTTNKEAKFLMDEYRRISNEYTWKFEIVTARVNQPLQTPGMMDLLDSYLSRGELTDPPHLIPFLTELSTDERLPLMARNHATRLIKQIEKAKK